MILDDLKNARPLRCCTPAFERVSSFLSGGLTSLDSGKYELDGERLFALVNRDPGRGRAGRGSKRIASTSTFNCSVDGSEEIGWRPTANAGD